MTRWLGFRSPADRRGFLSTLTARLACRVLVWIPAVRLCVTRASQGDQVFGSVVIRDAIDVVDNFARAKWPSVRLFPDNTMLRDIAFRIGAGVIGHREKDVAIISDSSALPTRCLISGPQDALVPSEESERLTDLDSSTRVASVRNGGRLSTATQTEAGWVGGINRLTPCEKHCSRRRSSRPMASNVIAAGYRRLATSAQASFHVLQYST